jgi:hypothetical protein
MLNKWSVGLVVVLAGAAAIGYGVHRYREEVQRRVVAELALAGQQYLNDSTVARLTVETAAKDSLAGLLVAARQLHGTLISGVVLRVPAQRGLFEHATLTTDVRADLTRYARFIDTTFAGVIEGTVTAPPCCAPLGITYEVRRPEFRPQVGFVQVGGRVVATVVWGGEAVQISAPFSSPPPTRPKLLGGFLEANYRPFDGIWGGRAGGLLRGWWGLQGFAGVDYRESVGVLVGVRKEW